MELDYSADGFKVVYEREGNKYFASVNAEFKTVAGELTSTNKMIVVLLHKTGTHIFTLEPGDDDNWISNDVPDFIEKDIVYEISTKVCDKYM
jgi:hypothetical protein